MTKNNSIFLVKDFSVKNIEKNVVLKKTYFCDFFILILFSSKTDKLARTDKNMYLRHIKIIFGKK